ncbi:hypothetical protein VPH35_129296 [Triticum aestivum]
MPPSSPSYNHATGGSRRSWRHIAAGVPRKRLGDAATASRQEANGEHAVKMPPGGPTIRSMSSSEGRLLRRRGRRRTIEEQQRRRRGPSRSSRGGDEDHRGAAGDRRTPSSLPAAPSP